MQQMPSERCIHVVESQENGGTDFFTLCQTHVLSMLMFWQGETVNETKMKKRSLDWSWLDRCSQHGILESIEREANHPWRCY